MISPNMSESVTPSGLGYRMPAEWEPHEATWISWPQPECNSFPGSYDRVIPTFVKMAEALAESEIVRINVSGAEQEKAVRKLLRSCPPDRIEFFHIPTDEPWCRDHGPIFVKRDKSPQLAVLNFGFNAWGYKLSPFDEDNAVPPANAKAQGLPNFNVEHFILEGGSIDTNGQGTLLTTESCLLNPNRNPGWSQTFAEAQLARTLGAKKVLWLGEGLMNDHTDGHVDNLARFVAPGVVASPIAWGKADPNAELYDETARQLAAMFHRT
jgi:agmatine deiminase